MTYEEWLKKIKNFAECQLGRLPVDVEDSLEKYFPGSKLDFNTDTYEAKFTFIDPRFETTVITLGSNVV